MLFHLEVEILSHRGTLKCYSCLYLPLGMNLNAFDLSETEGNFPLNPLRTFAICGRRDLSLRPIALCLPDVCTSPVAFAWPVLRPSWGAPHNNGPRFALPLGQPFAEFIQVVSSGCK